MNVEMRQRNREAMGGLKVQASREKRICPPPV